MGLDDVHNAPISLVYPMQSAAFSSPQEEVTVIGTRGDKLIVWTDEVDCKRFSIVKNECLSVSHKYRTILYRPQVRYPFERPPWEDQWNVRVLRFCVFLLLFLLFLFVVALIHLHIFVIKRAMAIGCRRGVSTNAIVWPCRGGATI